MARKKPVLTPELEEAGIWEGIVDGFLSDPTLLLALDQPTVEKAASSIREAFESTIQSCVESTSFSRETVIKKLKETLGSGLLLDLAFPEAPLIKPEKN